MKRILFENHSKKTAFGLCAGFFLLASAPCDAQAQDKPQTPLKSGTALAPPMQRIGQSLYDHGVSFLSRYLGEFASNPSGGQKQGSAFAGELNFNAVFDMNKIVGVQGGTIHLQFVDRMGQNLTGQQINNSVQAQQIYGAGKTAQLSILTWQQRFLDGKVDFYAGRTDIANDFIISPLYCYFQSNNICGHPSNYQKDTQISSNPAAIWGGRIVYAPTMHFYAKTGAYQTDPTLNPYANHGFDFSTRKSGFSIPFEFGYVGDSSNSVVPNHYDVGVIFNRSAFSAAYFNPTAPNQYGRTLVYVEAQQRLFQQAPNSARGIYGFTSGLFGASGGKQQSNYQLALGAIWQGPFAGHADDSFAIMGTDTHYNHDYLNSLYKGRVTQGGTQFPYSHLMIGEVNYTYQVNSWINFTPNIQYIIHPDGLGFAKYPKANLGNALVIGLQFNLNLNAFLGYPVFKPSPAEQAKRWLTYSRAE